MRQADNHISLGFLPWWKTNTFPAIRWTDRYAKDNGQLTFGQILSVPGSSSPPFSAALVIFILSCDLNCDVRPTIWLFLQTKSLFYTVLRNTESCLILCYVTLNHVTLQYIKSCRDESGQISSPVVLNQEINFDHQQVRCSF